MIDADLPIEGRFVAQEHRFPVRVYFEDTDLSGVVYHANYLRYMERARSDMLQLVGIDQRAAFEAGEGAYAISRLNIRYAQSAKLGDALVVVSRTMRARAASVDIHQRVMRCVFDEIRHRPAPPPDHPSVSCLGGREEERAGAETSSAQLALELIAEAEIEVAFVAPNGRPKRQPAEWMAAFAPLIWKGN